MLTNQRPASQAVDLSLKLVSLVRLVSWLVFMLESELEMLEMLEMLDTSDDLVVDSDDRDDLESVGDDSGSGPRSAKYG